jgi:(E)-4-hydroxy-3-methylbut-2-enyl-diphosphate synthase
VMGCVVNGPGEGRAADIGVAGGNGKGVLFKKGQIFRTVREDQIVDAMMEEIEKM